MPAHIGFADKVKLGVSFLAMNLRTDKLTKAARRVNGHHLSVLQKVQERVRASREIECKSYAALRGELDKFDPDYNDRTTYTPCSQLEWDLYLQPGTAFDITCQRYWEVFRKVDVTLIMHKKDRLSLKRIEATPEREAMRVLWSDAG
jgi:hypothetical protein